MAFTYEYPRPTVTVDALLFAVRKCKLNVLLIQRGREPFTGRWALPGGFMEMEEPAELAAMRELAEETGIQTTDIGDVLRPLGAATRPGRDPRARCITLVFAGLIDADRCHPQGADDAAAAGWHALDALPELAFDHAEVLAGAQAHLCWQARTAAIGWRLLGDRFTAERLEELHQVVLDRAAYRDTALDRGLRLDLLERAPDAPGCWRFRTPVSSALLW